jgi:hypothetical protein
MTTAITHSMLTDLAADGATLGRVLAATACLPDGAHAALPDVWRELLASLTTMIVDDGMSATEVAAAAGLPVEAVRSFSCTLELV